MCKSMPDDSPETSWQMQKTPTVRNVSAVENKMILVKRCPTNIIQCESEENHNHEKIK